MERYLMILEVSQKQAYIFASRKLRDNLRRSEEICYVTSAEFFVECCPGLFNKLDNMVYVGGGHTVLEFPDAASAKAFAEAVTERVLRQFPEMALFVRIRAYDFTKTPGENLTLLAGALEEKKARRRASFYPYSFGIDKLQTPLDSFAPVPASAQQVPEGWEATNDGEQLAGKDNFLAVVHVDGNAMGARVQRIYDQAGGDWEACKELLWRFSMDINAHFSEAFTEMTEELAPRLAGLGWNRKDLAKQIEAWKWSSEALPFPVRKVIGAGDDVCFITAGSLALDCAASFISHLVTKRNGADNMCYAACAGVCMVHTKYPFRTAYDMSEALCSNAKSFGASIDPAGNISAMDWHIEFGQLKESLSRIRLEDYMTDDGAHLELRPYAVCGSPVPEERQYASFARLMSRLQAETKAFPRSKVKRLREGLKQGEHETRLILRMTRMEPILALVDAPEAFCQVGEKERRCLLFDAIEVMDHTTLWRGKL